MPWHVNAWDFSPYTLAEMKKKIDKWAVSFVRKQMDHWTRILKTMHTVLYRRGDIELQPPETAILTEMTWGQIGKQQYRICWKKTQVYGYFKWQSKGIAHEITWVRLRLKKNIREKVKVC